jgi:hypothetical protein
MNDRPQDRADDRRRRGPLGDEGDAAEETRRVPQSGEDATTGRIPPEDAERETTRAPASEGARRRGSDEEDPETRVIRTPGARSDEAMPYPEAPELREDHLREVYGGVDYLASFIGCVFALLCGGLLLAFAGLAFNLLGFTLDLAGRQLDATIITGLAIIGLVLLIAYFLGGYVAGRLARFDGGRNGAVTVAWGFLLSIILALFGSFFLPEPFFGLLQNFVTNSIQPALTDLTQAGLVGAGIAVGAILLALLGGFLGGRLGNSYHTRIDETI